MLLVKQCGLEVLGDVVRVLAPGSRLQHLMQLLETACRGLCVWCVARCAHSCMWHMLAWCVEDMAAASGAGMNTTVR